MLTNPMYAFIAGLLVCQINQVSPVPMVCSDPGTTTNAVRVIQGYNPGDLATYTCARGYTFTSHPHPTLVLECLANGAWNRSTVGCTKVECPVAGTVVNGVTNSTGNVYGDAAIHTCNHGYSMTDGARQTAVVCQASGQWDRPTPTCNKVECPPPEDVPFTIYDPKTYYYPDDVQYTCQSGYALISGQLNISCMVTGNWNGSWPACEPVECGDPGSLTNASRLLTGTTFPHTVLYTCQRGYERDSTGGVLNRTCLSSRMWSGETPACVGVYCGVPTVVPNSNHTSSVYRYPEHVTYTCHPGYEPDYAAGVDTITCKFNGGWDLPPHTCKRIICHDNSTVVNAELVSGGTLYYETSKRYKCVLGYKVANGTLDRVCQADKTLSGSPPICDIVQCADIGEVINSNRTVNGFGYADTLVYTCAQGYELAGKVQQSKITLMCQKDETWSDATPQCVRVDCGDPGATKAENMTYVEGVVYDSHVHYSCNHGYLYDTGSSVRLCGADRKWTGSNFKCKARPCVPVPVVNNTIVVGTDLSFGGRILLRCVDGYRKVVQGGEYTCDANAMWVGIEPVCEKVVCPAPYELPGAMLVNATYSQVFRFDDITTYSCKPGYSWVSASGSLVRTCGADARWGGAIPECERVGCGDPGPVKGTFKLGFSYKFGDTVNYTCSAGHEAVLGRNWKVMTCQETGTWDGTPPQCTRVVCGDPGPAENATRTVGGVRYGDRITYTCLPGYFIPDGIGVIQCYETRKWSYPVPRCVTVPEFNSSATVQAYSGPPAEGADSTLIGQTGIILMGSVAGILVLLDVATIWRDLHFMYRNVRHGVRKMRKKWAARGRQGQTTGRRGPRGKTASSPGARQKLVTK